MHLLLLHQNFVDHAHPGGTRHLELGTHLVSMEHAVTIVASNLDYLTGRKIPGDREVLMDGVRVLRAPAIATLHHSFAGRAISYLSFMFSSVWVALSASKPDVVMGTSPPLFQLPSAWIVARWHRKPFVLEIRDLWPKFAIEMGLLKNRFLIRIATWVEHFFYRAADHIVVNSPAYKDYLLEKGVADDCISVIPNGVDVSAFDPEADGRAVRERLELQNEFIVTYAGAMGPANDLWTLLRAAKRLVESHPDIHFVIAGGGIEKEGLQSYAADEALKNVTFAGHFSKREVPQLLAASNACVACLQDLEAFRTVFPNKVFDYMAAGRPTVLAIDGVIRKVIEDSEGGRFVPPGNDEMLAKTLAEIAHDPQGAVKMGASARSYVAEHFDRKKQAEQFHQLIAELTNTIETVKAANI